MALSGFSGVNSLYGINALTRANRDFYDSSRKLASGSRIPSASFDPAGLAVAQRLSSVLRSLEQADRNTGSGIDMAQVAEGALGSQSDIASRMRELSVQAANGTLSAADRANMQTEFSQLNSELERIGNVTQFNGQPLLTGTLNADIQVGTEGTANDRVALTAAASNTTVSADISTQAGAQAAIASMDTRIAAISSNRSRIGATQSRLQIASNNTQVAVESTAAAFSRINDVDVAKESAVFTAAAIRQRGATSVLAQTNLMYGELVSKLLG